MPGPAAGSLASVSASAKSEQVKQYLENTVVPTLTQALTQMCVQEPEDPIYWLAQWLVENHPTKPAKAEWHEALVLKLSAGDYFGEIALLSGKPRQASVKAIGTVTALVMSRDAFTRLCGNLFDILKRNMSKYSDMELSGDAPEACEDVSEEPHEEVEEEAPPPAALAGRQRQGRRQNVFVQAVTLEDDWVAPTYPKDDAEKAKLGVYLSKTALLAYLDPKSKATVIEAFQKKTFSNGDNIITQGDEGDYYYILDSGSADALLSKPPGSPEIKVAEYSNGGAFGELALIHGEPRAATVRATTDCVCYALDRDTFRKIMMQQGKSDMGRRVALLGKVSILEELAPFERFKIAEAMEMRTYNDGETIIAEGDPGFDFFIIQEGNCHCLKKTLRF